ncbi:hypothetical protein MTR67_034666 [Solanum verrucosum]|uniref:Uncharacterized protein n=1 Tax=Solanum verrucosum TaxID=315347 RepID=A0AAF0ZIZ8_SOLVR|nr:hypothetical protein MTR67_034666 [Solanum verrucosum]
MPFTCLIFHVCVEATIPLWHCDRLVEADKTVDVGLIKDDANPAASRKKEVSLEPKPNAPSLDPLVWLECTPRRVRELDVGASGSRSTIDGVPTTIEGITDGVTLVDPVVSEKPDPPVS